MANKKITYGIGFQVDKQGLKQVQDELQKIAKMTDDGLRLHGATQGFDEIKKSASELSGILDKAFNQKLGTYNLNILDKEFKNLGQKRLGEIQQKLTQVKGLGDVAFTNLAKDVLTANNELAKSSKLISDLGKTLGNTIKWSISSSLINAFTGSIQKAWSYAQKLDESLNNIRIVTGKSAEDMEKFAKQANKAAKELGSSTTSYTNASLIYYQQGLNEKDVQARTKTTIKAANVTGQSAAEVSEQLTAVWNGYKVVAEEAELYVDKLAAVAATTAADLEELSTGMSKVASAANAMGVDIDQLSAQLATIVSVTRQDASVVGTALKTIYSRMGDLKVDGMDEFGVSLGDVSGQLKQMGIEVLDQEGNLRDMGIVIEEVAVKWGTWTEAQQQAAAVAIAGKRQYNNLIALFENWEMYESALTTSKTSEGTLQKQQETYMESLEYSLNKLSVAGEKFFDALIDNKSTKKLIDFLATLVEFLANAVEGFGGLGNILLSVGAITTHLFSGQIIGAISKFAHNTKVAFGAITGKDLKVKESLLEQFKELDKNSKAIDNMTALREQELKLSRHLSEEEKSRYETLIKEQAAIEQRKHLLNNEYIDIQNEASAWGVKDINAEGAFDTVLNKLTGSDAGQGQALINQIDTHLRKINKTDGAITKKGAASLFNKTAKQASELFGTDTTQAYQLEDLRNSTESYNQKLIKLKKLIKEAQVEVKGFSQAAEENKKAVKENTEEQDKFNKEQQELLELGDKRKIAGAITDIASVTMGMISLGVSISNLTKLAKEGEAQFGDYAGAVAAAATSAMASIGKAIASGNKIIIIVTIVLEALAAIIGLLNGLGVFEKKKSALEIAEENLKSAQESAKNAREEYSRLNQELQDLNATIEDLKIKELDLGSLIPGTVAYKEAITDLNSQLLQIVELYPQLAKYLDFENGRFVLKEGTLEDFQKELEELEKLYEARIFSSQVQSYNIQEEVLAKKWSSFAGLSSSEIAIDPNNFYKENFGKNEEKYAYVQIDLAKNKIGGATNEEIDASYAAIENAGLSTKEWSTTQYLRSSELWELSLEELTKFQKELPESQKNIHNLIDKIIDAKLTIDDNSTQIAQLNETYNNMLANELGWETNAGQSVLNKHLNDIGKGGAVDLDFIKDVVDDFNFEILFDAKEKYIKDEFGNKKKIGATINNQTDIDNLNNKINEVAETYGWTVTRNLSLSDDVKGKSVNAIKDEKLLTINGQEMSIYDLFTLAAEVEKKDEISDVNKTLKPYKDAAKAAGLGEWAVGFGVSETDTDDNWVWQPLYQQYGIKNWEEFVELDRLIKSGKTKEQALAEIESEREQKEFEEDYNSIKEDLSFSELSGNLKYIVNGQEIDLSNVKTKWEAEAMTAFNNNDKFNEYKALSSTAAFTIKDWKDFGTAYKINSDRFTKDILNDVATLKQVISLINNDETVYKEYIGRLGVSAEFGKYKDKNGNWISKTGYSGIDIRDMVIDNYKLELDYTKQIADEMERAFGTNRLKLLKEMAAQQELSAELATKQFYNLIGGATAADTTQFLNEDGSFDYIKLLDYQAKVKADFGEDSDAYVEIEKILEAYEKMEESAWAVTDAKIKEYRYQYEIIESVKKLRDEFVTLQEKTHNWSQGISAYGATNFADSYTNLTEKYSYLKDKGFNLYKGQLNELANFNNIPKDLSKYISYNGGLWTRWASGSEEFLKEFEESLYQDANIVKGSISEITEGDKNGYDKKWTYQKWDEEKIKKTVQNNPYLRWDTTNQEFILDEAAWAEDYESALSSAMSELDKMISTVDQLFELWKKGIEEVQQAYDKTINKVKDVNSIIKNTIEINSLFGTTVNAENYNAIIKYSEASSHFLNEKVNSLLLTYKKAVASGNQELIDSAKQALMSATEEVTAFASEHLELIKEKFKTLTSSKIDKALKNSGYGSLTQLSQNWELEKAKDEMYLDEVNEQYAKDELNRAFQKSIDETDSIYAQNKLMEKRIEIENELADIKKEQGKLTQYDLDRANALYDLTLKQIALEEAQKTSNKMKLVRDASGNYTYQYVQDQDAIADAEAELAAAQNNLYNLDKDRKRELIDDFFAMWTEYQEKMAEAIATGDEDIQQRVYDSYLGEHGMLNMLKTQLGLLGEEAGGIAEAFDGTIDFSNAIVNFSTEGFNTIVENTQKDVAALKDIVGTIQGTMNNVNAYLSMELKNTLGINAKTTAETISKSLKDGILGTGENSLSSLTSAITGYMQEISNLQATLGTNYSTYIDKMTSTKAIDGNTRALTSLTAVAFDLLDQLEQGEGQGDGIYNGYQREKYAGADGIFDWFPIVAGDK